MVAVCSGVEIFVGEIFADIQSDTIIVYSSCRGAKLVGLVAVASEERVCANLGKGLGRSSV